jgi:hypothetical protein
MVRSVLSAFLLVVVVLAVGAVVVLSSINRLNNPGDGGSAAGQPGPAAPEQPVRSAPARSQQLLREGGFETGMGVVRAQRGSLAELVAGVGADSAHSVRLSNVGPPVGRAGVLADRVGRPPRQGSRFTATVQVKAGRPGQLVQIRLVESFAGQRTYATAETAALADTSWREVVVQHQIKTDSSILGVEVTVTGIGPGDLVWIDNLGVTQTR